MCCDTQLKQKFHHVGFKEFFYKTYLDKDTCPAFNKHALSIVSVFGNTYAA